MVRLRNAEKLARECRRQATRADADSAQALHRMAERYDEEARRRCVSNLGS